ncbi:MAG: tetratricopeptide repeat protein [Gammaproteobacteria bacterium]|nr:tetratricopeptide repeat protein [Gammaproteobacteria bacterium]
MTRWISMFVLLMMLWSCPATQDSDNVRQLRTVRHPHTADLEVSVRRSLEKALAQWSVATQTASTLADEAAAYAKLGKVYLARHFYIPAADAFSIAGQLTTAPPEWHYLEGIALRNAHQPEAALRAFQEARKFGPFGNASYYCAEIMVGLGDIQRARIALDAIPDEPATRAAVQALAGRVARAQTRYADAEVHYREALALQPEATALYGPLAQVVHRQSRRSEARRILKRAGEGTLLTPDAVLEEISRFARDVPYYLDYGQTLMRQRKFLAAAKEFAAAVDLDPGNARARLSYGRALEIIGNFEDARLHYSQALKAQPDFPIAHYFFGSFLERQGQLKAAQHQYAIAVEQDPDYLPPRLLLAHMYFRAGDFATAKEHYLAVSTLQSRHVQARFYAALASLVTGDCITALKVLEEAGKVNPKDASVQEVLARTYAHCADIENRLDLARDIGEQINADRPDSGAAQTLAMVYAAKQEFERAVDFQELALQRASGQEPEFMREALQRYQAGLPPTSDWVIADPDFFPPLLTTTRTP